MKDLLLVLSVIISFAGYLVAIKSILKGDFKPQRMTRLIILIVVSISTLSLFANGERVGLFLALAQTLASTLIFILSIKFGIGGRNKLDFVVLVLALLALIAWKATDNPIIALYMSIFADFIGMFPTLIKAYKQPFTEEPLFYLADFFAGILNMLALSSFTIKDLAFPGYIFLINGVLMAVILVRRKGGIDKL